MIEIISHAACDMLFLQDSLCMPEHLGCIQNTTPDTSMCIHKCNGMMITSYSKLSFDEKLQDYIPREISAYKKYKKIFKAKRSSQIKGFVCARKSNTQYLILFSRL